MLLRLLRGGGRFVLSVDLHLRLVHCPALYRARYFWGRHSLFLTILFPFLCLYYLHFLADLLGPFRQVDKCSWPAAVSMLKRYYNEAIACKFPAYGTVSCPRSSQAMAEINSGKHGFSGSPGGGVPAQFFC